MNGLTKTIRSEVILVAPIQPRLILLRPNYRNLLLFAVYFWYIVCLAPCWLLPSVLRSLYNPGCSVSSGTLTQAIRNFAKSLEGWLTNAMTNFPQEIIRTKVTRTSLDPLFWSCLQNMRLHIECER